jgi:hypothetical protein
MEARTVGKSSAVAFDAPGELNNVAVARTREFVITCLAVGIYLDVFPASQKMQPSPTPERDYSRRVEGLVLHCDVSKTYQRDKR